MFLLVISTWFILKKSSKFHLMTCLTVQMPIKLIIYLWISDSEWNKIGCFMFIFWVHLIHFVNTVRSWFQQLVQFYIVNIPASEFRSFCALISLILYLFEFLRRPLLHIMISWSLYLFSDVWRVGMVLFNYSIQQ